MAWPVRPGLFPLGMASMMPKLSTLFRGLLAVVLIFSKKIAELGSPLIVPKLVIVYPDSIGLIASEDVPTPVAITRAPVWMVTVELLLNSMVLNPSP
jgi:hypothetical protein